MFWIGVIVGVIAWTAICLVLAPKLSNMSAKEYVECIGLIQEAGQSRESTVSVWHDGMLLDTVVLEEKE